MVERIFAALMVLHAVKDKAYGSEWRIFGMLSAERQREMFARVFKEWNGSDEGLEHCRPTPEGFSSFLSILARWMRRHQHDGHSLKELVETEILPIGRECSESWLMAVNELADTILKPLGNGGLLGRLMAFWAFLKWVARAIPRGLSPEYRLRRMFQLLPALALAVERHGEASPEERDAFLAHWRSG